MILIFATNNKNKVLEVSQIIGNQFIIKTLNEINCFEDLPETQPTFQGNALQKARHVYDNYGPVNCFSEDTGLEVEALDGAPGVITARYAGTGVASDNMNLLLKNLGDNPNRKAQFRTVFALILDGKEYLFEDICKGSIRLEQSGEGGFGYDPIFEPDGYDVTFAEMDKSIKNVISHRGKAMQKMLAFLMEGAKR